MTTTQFKTQHGFTMRYFIFSFFLISTRLLANDYQFHDLGGLTWELSPEEFRTYSGEVKEGIYELETTRYLLAAFDTPAYEIAHGDGELFLELNLSIDWSHSVEDLNKVSKRQLFSIDIAIKNEDLDRNEEFSFRIHQGQLNKYHHQSQKGSKVYGYKYLEKSWLTLGPIDVKEGDEIRVSIENVIPFIDLKIYKLKMTTVPIIFEED